MSLDATTINGLEPDRLHAAYEKARAELLNQRDATGHWIGELSASALSTATAVSALSCVARAAKLWSRQNVRRPDSDELRFGGTGALEKCFGIAV
jgi:hypothetical protein